jgi:exopolyphosphatase/pppGpp-phosphohydrolase
MNNYEIDYINSRLIELYNFVFADSLLPFGSIWGANTHCTHLQIAQADTQTKICKRVQFQPLHKEQYRLGIHGIEHAYRVLRLVQELSKLERLDQEQKIILEFCAIFHDIGRINDDVDDFHGKRSISKLNKCQYFGLNHFNIPIVKYIIENHCISDKVGLKKIHHYNCENNSEAKYLLSIFKDADGLDRVRLDDFDPNFLRIQNSKSLITYAVSLFEAHKLTCQHYCKSEYINLCHE